MANQTQHEPGRATVADDPYDNRYVGPAFAESFWSRLKAELLEGGCFLSVDDARTEVFDRAACAVRKHSSLGYKSPEYVGNEYHTKLASLVCRQIRPPQSTDLLQHIINRTDSYNAWTGEGTENHVGMSRISGYLYAQQVLKLPARFPQARRREQEMVDWVKQAARQLYKTGVLPSGIQARMEPIT